MSTTFTLGILETGRPPEALEEEYGSYPQLFADMLCIEAPEWDFRAYRVNEGEFPFTLDECDAWLVTGSKHGVYDDLDWIEELKEFLEEAYEEGIPLVGICFGHQILAEALGGSAVKSRRGWGLGVQSYEVTEDGKALFPEATEFSLNTFHQDQVVEIPESAKVLAKSEFCPYAALSYGDRALSFQGHPEFDRAFTKALVENRRGEVLTDELADAALSTLDEKTDNDQLAQIIVKFIEDRAGKSGSGGDKAEGPSA
ncbi:type 1 glutamine amidotransferase [Pseudovibrio sp. SPO723]|uniref:type 1 glutamine amidotransferase n=1 Tax=Nesiotobacter zosterae TaxID=392721 RepID=UPI0029C32697|nr:type 1 glutamine amidotransferase [Pseudovibrio sp. SPO723]MDX5592893.1 type 1 glutamine amidotransferase [Pseudovibrio sp. SPO723]